MPTMKYLFVSALLALGTTSVMAQATQEVPPVDDNKYKGHFFLDVQAGGQYTVGEAKFGDLLSPNFQLAVGYQFSPVFGLRLQANGLNSKGGLPGFRAKKGDTPENVSYKFSYVAPGLDLMFNLNNLFAGWNPNRVVNATLYLGGGINFASGNSELNDLLATVQNPSDYPMENLWQGSMSTPFGRVGLGLEFKVGKRVSILLEGNANFVSDKYNSKKGEGPDSYYNVLAGLRFNLGKSYSKATNIAPATPDPGSIWEDKMPEEEENAEQEYNSQTENNANQEYNTEPSTGQNPESTTILESNTEPTTAPVSKTEPTITPVSKTKPTPAPASKTQPTVQTNVKKNKGDIFFTVGGNKVTDSENRKILELIDFLVANPKSQVLVTTYTTNVDSGNRIASVTKMLNKIYGIPSDRFGEAKKGQKFLTYTDNDNDRIIITIVK